MAKVAVYNMEGKEVDSIELNDSIFGVEINEHLVHMAVLQQLANNRQGTQKAKTRSEVRGGGRKPWRQKGTGHARQGSTRAPQWTGGGVVFAPVPRDYSFKLNKKEKRAALKSVLTSKVAEGKLVVVDDELPAEEGYFDATESTEGAVKIVANSASPADGEIKLSAATPYFGSKTLAAGMYVVLGTRYTTFALGKGAISYEDIGAKVPYEMSRDPKTNGGQDTLYIRQRKCFAPFGISYEKASQASNSPTDAELSNGANWVLVHTGEAQAASRSYINHKAIPIARIYSRG